MSKKCKMTLILIGCAIVVSLLLLITTILFKGGAFYPTIHLNGNKEIWLELNEEYLEEGATAKYRFKKIIDEIQILGEVDSTRIGDYEISYQLKDRFKQRKIHVRDTQAPKMTLIGNSTLHVFQDEPYIDPGVEASDNSGISKEELVKIESPVNVAEIGEYVVTYVATDKSGNSTSVTRTVVVNENPEKYQLHYQYDHYDNTSFEWWFNKSENHERMEGAISAEILAKYQSYYLGKDEKVIYLTYDEGGNDITYIHEIADVLNQYQIPATFFLTRNYVLDNEVFMRDLVKNGHLIGNHTRHHYDMPNYATEAGLKQFTMEILETEKAIWKVTGVKPEKVFRFPKGATSERSMKIVSDLGYKNFFWSHAYYDYAGDVSKKEAYDTMINHLHNGAIYLLHPSNKGNYLALEDFIKAAQKEGYRFALVSEID